MKIISLRFANLNSLLGSYHIRFDAAPLADTGLFAITGPTGAGKSTLLDAIAVGLYGRVPRHDRQVGEMVSRHAAYAFSEVEFEVHETNADTGLTQRVRYCARWEVKRKTRGEDKGGLGQDAMSLVLVRGAVREAVISGKEAVPAKVGELSGLDFGQFEQAVLLSQGKFARFLHAPEKERSALLEKMTNVGIYSRLSVAAFEKAKEEARKTELLAARLDATRLLSEDERAALTSQLDTLSEAAEQHHEEAQDLNLCLTWRTLLDQLDRQLRDTTREVETLRQADEALQPDFARLTDHQRAKELATPLALAEVAHKTLQDGTAQLTQLQQALPSLATATTTAQATLAAATTAHLAAQTEENRLRPLLEEARTQDTAIATTRQQLGKKQAAHTQNQQAHEQAQAAWHQQAQALQALTAQHTALDSWLIDHSHEAELKSQLLAIGRELSDLQGAQREIATREAHRAELLKNQQATAADLGSSASKPRRSRSSKPLRRKASPAAPNATCCCAPPRPPNWPSKPTTSRRICTASSNCCPKPKPRTTTRPAPPTCKPSSTRQPPPWPPPKPPPTTSKPSAPPGSSCSKACGASCAPSRRWPTSTPTASSCTAASPAPCAGRWSTFWPLILPPMPTRRNCK
jgi:exonuclease SbcC